MEENKPVPINYELLNDEKPILVIEGRKRRKQKKKAFKKIFLLLLTCCLVFVAVIKFGEIKEFINIKFPLSYDEETNESNESEQENNEIVDKNQPSEGQITYAFIDTSPDVFKTINESSAILELEKYSYALPKQNDITNAYSSTAPIVLIVHFSPLEAYSTSDGYTQESDFYSSSNNVMGIGEEICKLLTENGINTIHLSDYGYEGELKKCKELYVQKINEILQENPSISYIFDISRGLDINSDLSMNKEAITINEDTLPTIQLLCGTNGKDITAEQGKGIFLAKELANYINSKAPLFVSKQIIAPYSLYQDFSCPAIRVDIGSYSCNYSEAMLTARLFSTYLIDFLS